MQVTQQHLLVSQALDLVFEHDQVRPLLLWNTIKKQYSGIFSVQQLSGIFQLGVPCSFKRGHGIGGCAYSITMKLKQGKLCKASNPLKCGSNTEHHCPPVAACSLFPPPHWVGIKYYTPMTKKSSFLFDCQPESCTSKGGLLQFIQVTSQQLL